MPKHQQQQVLLLVTLVFYHCCLVKVIALCQIVTTTRTFELAPNGVCLNPSRFVVVDEDNNASRQQEFTMKNVPGDGDCLFLAVALATLASMGIDGNDALLRAISRETRELVANVLEQPDGNLLIEGKRLVRTSTLLKSAASQEGLDNDEYLERLRLEGMEGGLYGGGPELTVLCNILRRPISVYELDTTEATASVIKDGDSVASSISDTTTHPIVCKGAFGEEMLADPLLGIPGSAILSSAAESLPGLYSWHLHILILDVSATEKHACVLLPQPSISI